MGTRSNSFFLISSSQILEANGPQAQSSSHGAFLGDSPVSRLYRPSISNSSQTDTPAKQFPVQTLTLVCLLLFQIPTAGCLFRPQFKWHLLLTSPFKRSHAHSSPLTYLVLLLFEMKSFYFIVHLSYHTTL